MGEIMAEKLDLDALERLHEATSKDWSIPNARVGSVVVGGPMQTFTNGTAQQQIAMFCGNDATDEQQRDANAAFVVALHAVFPAMIARIRALESRASNAGGAVYQALHVDTCTWEDVTAEYYTERLPSNRRILYTHPAPASKEPVADERAAEFDDLIDVYQSAQKDGSLDDRANARAALKSAYRAALATAQTWQPIETAPKDGKILLLMGDTIHIGYWSDEKYAARPKPYWATVASWFGVTWMRNNQPTHWMPLPAAPAKPEGV